MGRTEALHGGRVGVKNVVCGGREGIEMVLGEPARRRRFGVLDVTIRLMRCDAHAMPLPCSEVLLC